MSWKTVNDYRDPQLGKQLLQHVEKLAQQAAEQQGRPIKLMEVCGTHTMVLARSGIRSLLGKHLEILSGPGCPVCVTSQTDIDRMLALSREPGVIITTFGDMMRVPGSQTTLLEEKSQGRDIRIVYSPLDSLEIAASNPDRQVIFFGIGFETTIPVVAVALEQALRRRLTNFMLFSVQKLALPGIAAVLADPELKLDGLILPGNISVVVGESAFRFIAEQYQLPSVIAGFEVTDMLAGIATILESMLAGQAQIINNYNRVVAQTGNTKAQELMAKYFEPLPAEWRGLGTIPATGLALRQEYNQLDAAQHFVLPVEHQRELPGCRCGDILRGKATPFECKLYGNRCSPLQPVGPCMVSSEGTCAAYYQFDQRRGHVGTSR